MRVKVARIAKDPDKDDFGGYMVVQGSSTATRLVLCSSRKLNATHINMFGIMMPQEAFDQTVDNDKKLGFVTPEPR